MVSFNFSLPKNKTIKAGVKTTSVFIDGVVVMVNDIYKIKSSNNFYDIHPNSITTKHQKIIYSKRLDENNHRIKIIRSEEDAIDIGTKFYSNIAVGLKVKCKLENNLCYITKIYHETKLNDILIETIKDMFFEYDEI